ncbi:hypothetical protein G6F57_008998 [Rhizopus arrhizus]|uniref:Uncharacterized protein n=1 Tax=Rhizopus oryzae TaxID=64495 RepID=A0A9P7BMF1_RHIOR|nr:hypothetical protein G6F23_008038 [Rhizopus arrhizus]KAG1395070.1 hypothetical protein G6F58_012013 [Rhizopus delemar]KAG0761451.1 hypothetical protein G6F24_007556 [Rhizopus arrhizus]KAG0776872.1 hypothetical protein G6F22_012264 [Rhizopus arrhizus]KAG0785324.1 hypothetical protein G6F21_009332 [Rhizopus arrhizus]
MAYRPSVYIVHNQENSYIQENERLPLTKENLINLSQSTTLMSNEILERYCQEISRPARYDRRQSSVTTTSPDTVLASPRLLPFPYHNDSLFLPTAEQLQYNLTTSSSSSSYSQTEISSLFSSNLPITCPHSAVHIKKCRSNNGSSFSASRISPERRSLPAKMEHSIKPRHSTVSGCTRQTSFRSSTHSTASSIYKESSSDKKPWLKRLLKFLSKNKGKLNRKQPLQNQPKNKLDQVWFCQFSKNPTNFIENQQLIATVS